MFWVIVAIVVAGLIIAAAIKSSAREANMTPEQRAAVYQARQDIETGKNARELCNTVYLLSRKGKTNRQIAGNVTVQRYANAIGLNITGEETILELKRDQNFLMIVGIFDKFKALAVSGISDKKIASKLYREFDILALSVYTAEDIAYMRKNILGHNVEEEG
jgi:hypothetical protein